MHVIKSHHLMGNGIGYIDVHLIASALLQDDVRLWTRDKQLKRAADDARVGFEDDV